MDKMRIISYSEIFHVLNELRRGPRTIDELENACKLVYNDLRAVLSSAIYRGLVDQRRDEFMLTKKGARTALYLLIIYESRDYPKNEYREIMYAFNKVLNSSDPQTVAT
jgi:predicted transcriptional regulator